MVNFTVNQIRALMDKQTNIRNMCVIAPAYHGEPSLVESLLEKAGIITTDNTHLPDASQDVTENRITIKPIMNPMFHELDSYRLSLIKQPADGQAFLINLIGSHSHGDFSDATATLRVTDGVLVVVDYVEGVCIPTENMLRQALAERVKPVLVIVGLDRGLLEFQISKEDLYQSFVRTIDSVNDIISTYRDTALGDLHVSPDKGTVAFSSALQGWGFTLRQFAARYGKQFGIDQGRIMAKLWGDNFYDRATRKWTTKAVDAEGKQLERSFNMFVLDPIFKIFDAVMNSQKGDLNRILDKLGIELCQEDRGFVGEALLKVIMQSFLPVSDSLLEMIIIDLPSPVTAQRYRVDSLYEGPMDDELALGIRNCDPNAPLILYVSRMVPTSDNGRFYGFGRVFSGTVRSGTMYRIQRPKYWPGHKDDLAVKAIERAILMMGRYVEPIEDCPAGNVIGLIGVDHCLHKSGTITSSETAYNMKAMKFSTAPVVQVAVEVKNAVDLPKLVEGLKHLSKPEPCIQTWVSETGEYIIAGASDLQLDICIKDLEDLAGVPLQKSLPIVGYRETVMTESSIVALSKSPNKHRSSKRIDSGNITSRDDLKTRARILADEYDWSIVDARKIWCFGPETTGPNLLVDMTRDVQNLNEYRDSVIAGFQWATKEGVCAEENTRGVRFNILDATIQGDTTRRGHGQMIPTTRCVCHAACLLATPGIQEPINLVEIQCPESAVGVIHSILSERRGQVFSVVKWRSTPTVAIKAYLPVNESFNFSAVLRMRTQGQAFSQSVFDHWENMDGSPLDKRSKLEELVRSIRTRKGLKPEIPRLEQYYDKL
ncbi:P-loop containing nucleoside triphosphate hydrolase protein [Rickenella mellea]|uniref:Elongation factor 2 n=1 Tax=Rickenella mellea TaxID=50990 RepID=A0A4Y7PQ39_9AGAM|nr:P-loop containing nucleoside triphosphate hydrolase protein [Rickenella mellea]